MKKSKLENLLQMEGIPTDKEILFVCSYGLIRSRGLAKHLRRRGYMHVNSGGVLWNRLRNLNPFAIKDYMLENAEYIIAVEPKIGDMINALYALKRDQRLILLNAPAGSGSLYYQAFMELIS